MNYLCFKPGALEIFCGPMKSGKTTALLNRLDMVPYTEHKYIMIKPAIDTRDMGIKSRVLNFHSECIRIDEKNPYDILKAIGAHHDIIAIDESQFFAKGIEEVVESLLKRDKNILMAGLDLDFRGEPFGRMHYLMALASEVTKLAAVCEFNKCGKPATRTQRLINGEPAPYCSDLILIGDKKDGYQARCTKHHIVPGKP